jgi:hypothetical protein
VAERLLRRLFRTRIPTDDAVAFVERHLGDAAAAVWRAPEWGAFLAHVAEHEDAAAQQEYRRRTGAGLNECHLAVQLARRATS